MKNRDRDSEHQRRRDLGDEDEDPDGRSIAEKLYGGLPTDPDKIDPQTDGE